MPDDAPAIDSTPTPGIVPPPAPDRARLRRPWGRAAAIVLTAAALFVAAAAQSALLHAPISRVLAAALIEGLLAGVALALLFVMAPESRAEAGRRWLIANLRELSKVDRRKSFSVLLERVEEHSMGAIVRACHDALATAHRDRLEAANLRREMDDRVHRQTRRAVAHISRLSNVDELSGLANRRGFEADLAEAFAAARSSAGPLTLLALDLDNFKVLNDTLGHPKGDEAIRALGEILSSSLREGDSAGRMGGDEFLVLLRNTDSQAARHMARRCMRLFASHTAALALDRLWPTISVGIASALEHHPDSPQSLIAMADQALYIAKRAGRDSIRILGEQPLNAFTHAPSPITTANSRAA